MKIKLISPADIELLDTYHYYEKLSENLGKRFLREFQNITQNISKFPLSNQLISNNTRHAVMNNFPYFLLYVVEDDLVLITCIAHQRKNPNYYIDRLI